MKKPRITKDELAQGLAGLQVGQGLEAKFYKHGGVVVVTFECMADADGKPETTFRMGRKSQLRRSYKDVDDVWNILTVDNGLEPPKELVPIAVPEKIRTKPTVQTGFVEMRGVLTDEQADKIATMMLYAAQYDGAFVDWPGLHIEKNDEENVQAIVSAIVRVCRSAGVELDEEKLSGLTKFSQYDFSTNIGEDAVKVLQSKYSDAPVYYNRKGKRMVLYKGAWIGGNLSTINIIYVDAYKPTGEYESVNKMEQMISRKEYRWAHDFEPSPMEEGRLQAERDNRHRIEDYEQRKDTFCHGIGQRRVKLFLNACIKAGDEVAQMYRLALEAEGVNLNAKKALKKYHSDYHAYDKKEECLRQLSDMCKRMSVVFGIQASTAPAARYVVYYELPGCEQVSFHTNEPQAAGWPKYDGAWDGKKCSTLGKLENAIWQRYENELTKKYLKD